MRLICSLWFREFSPSPHCSASHQQINSTAEDGIPSGWSPDSVDRVPSAGRGYGQISTNGLPIYHVKHGTLVFNQLNGMWCASPCPPGGLVGYVPW